MKTNLLKRCKKSQFFTTLFLVVLLMGCYNLHALELIVADGTATNQAIPVYGWYGDDNYQQSQTIYPASMISGMQGKSITKLTYYLSSSASEAWNGTFEVRLGTTTTGSFSSGTCNFLSGSSFANQTLVYSGALDATGTTMEINFSTPFTYTGGNLVVDVRLVGLCSDYAKGVFYGTSNSSYYSNQNKDEDATPPFTSGSGTDFMPKVMFTYGDTGSGGGEPGDGCEIEDFASYEPEGFNSATPIPTGWQCYSNSSSGYIPHVSSSSSYTAGAMSSVGSNYLLLITNNSSTERAYAIMPKYENLMSLSFKYVNENASKNNLSLGYVTSNTGYSTYQELRQFDGTTSITTYSLSATELAAINNNGGYVTFCCISNNTSYYGIAIDDIEVCTEGSSSCTPTWLTSDHGYIAKFEVTRSGSTLFTSTSTGTINTNTDYYDTRNFTVAAGDQLTFGITPSISSTFGFAVWIDYDKDGFESSDLIMATSDYFSASPTTPCTCNCTVPTTTAPGEYRVRIIQDWSTKSPSDPCGSYKYGESEDYKMIVTTSGQDPTTADLVIDDREDHSYSYYSSSSPIHSLNPMDITVEYDGNGVSYGRDHGSNSVGSIVYYKTLENSKADGSGYYYYKTIPGFVGRSSGAFTGWRVVSISSGMTVRNASTGTTYTTGSIIPAETMLRITSNNNYNNASANVLKLKADWSGSFNIQYAGSQSALESALANVTSGNEYSNFIVLTSNISLSLSANYKTPNTAPVTITSVVPNSNTDYNTTLTGPDLNYGYYWGPVKFENVGLSFNDLAGYSNVLIFGRGIRYTGSYVAEYVEMNFRYPGSDYASITTSDSRMRVESGVFGAIWGYYGQFSDTYSDMTVTSSFTYDCTIGNDYDRAKGYNNLLSIETYQASRYTIYSQYNTFNTYVKSGVISDWLYLGVDSYASPTYRNVLIEGGDMGEVAGGYVECSSASQESMFLRVKGGPNNNAILRKGVYGAAQHLDDVGKITMVFTGGDVKSWIAGGCNGTETDGGTLDGNTYLYVGGRTNVNSNGNTSIIDGSSSLGGMVYGAGSGIEGGTTVGQVNNSTVVIADNAYIERNVYGGGNYGFVASGGATHISILGGNIAGNVFGGSNEQVGQTVNIAMSGGTVNGNVYGGSNTKGTINNAATVSVSGGIIAGNIFGGGCGANTNMASSVTVRVSDSAYIAGHVFGGGEMGSSISSVVNILGGTIEGNVFGGALGTSGTVKMSGNKTVNMLGGIVYGNVYGGSRNANDTKDCYVNISGGTVDKNVYGGGFYGSITGNTFVNIGKNAVLTSANGSTGGGAAGQVVSGSNESEYAPLYTYYCDYGSKSEFIIPKSYFEAAGISSGTQFTSMTLTQSSPAAWVASNLKVRLSNTSTSSYSSTGFLGNSGTLVYSNSSYAASSAQLITFDFSTPFTYNGNNVIVQLSCESGGTYKTSKWQGVTTTTNQSYYCYNSSSSSTGYTSGNTLQTFLPSVAFGTGSGSGVIAGGTNSDKLVPSSVDRITIGESVYAGSDWGEFTAGGSFMDANITGVSNIFIDGQGYADGNLKIGNSIYGSGTSGDAGATAHDIVIRNVGVYSGSGNASFKLYTIQRANHVILDRAHIQFVGKGDIVSPATTKSYSMLNIDKHLVVANASSLVLSAPIEKLHSMGSYSCTNAYVLDTVAINYNGLGSCDNKIFLDNGCFININYDKNGVSTYGRLTGFFHATASSGHSSFAFARPKVNNNSGDAAYAGWSAYAPLNISDGGFVSYTASENKFNSIGGNTNNGVQIPYKHHPTNRDDSQFYRVWTTGEGVTENDVVITAVATGDSYEIITASATTELPRVSSNDGCSYYRITNIEWSDAAQFVNAGIYNNVPQYGHIYYDGNDITLSYGQTAAQCSEEINAINDNPNYTFGLTMIPTSNISFVNTDNSTVPAIVLSEDGEEYYSTTGNEIKMYPASSDQAKSKVTFMLTYSNDIISTQTFSPVILTIEEVECSTGNVLMTLHQNINIQTTTKIQDVEATVYARMYGTGPTHDSTTVKVVLPTWILTSGEEYSTLTVQNITNTPVAAGATRRASTYFNTSNGTTRDFGMTYRPAKENDNTLGWTTSHYLDNYFDNHTVSLPAMLGTADGRDQIAIDFTVHYNGQAYHNQAEDELSRQIYHVKMTNYEGTTKEFDITIHIRRRGQAQNWYISSTGSNANSGQYPDKPKRSVKALQNANPPYVAGDNIFVVGVVNINAPTEWDGSQYGNDMRIYRYPGKHKLSNGSTDGNNPYLGTMFNLNNVLHANYAFIDGMYGCSDVNLNPGGNLNITAQNAVFNITDDGSFILENGSIRNNRVVSSTEKAGAVNMEGSMTVDGEVVIDNNYLNGNKCNVFIVGADNKIGIENALNGSAKIGVTKTDFPSGSLYTPVAYSIEEINAVAAETYNEEYVFADNESGLYYNATATEYTNPYTVYIGSSDVYETACDSFEWNGTNYTQSGDYTYTDPVSHITTTLHLTINHSQILEYTESSCESYEWHGSIYTASGDFTYESTTDDGCPRVETLHLIINKNETQTYNVTECDSYVWHGVTYNEGGVYTFDTVTAAGCTRVETLNLTINNSATTTINHETCDTYTWYGHVYDESGTYTHVSTTSSGCALTEILNLTINNSESETFDIVECDSYPWHGQVYTESGVYNYQTVTAQGCAHIETLNLTINDSENVALYETSCDNYIWHGVTYNQSGSYPYETTTAAGCPHIETLNLTINNNTTESLSATACDEYTWHGQTYYQSGSYTFDTVNAAGCTHTQILSLTINHSEHPVFTRTECDNFTWYGQNYTESGIYTHETTTSSGCPRVETLNLTINYSEHPVFTETECDTYTWYGQNYNESGVYTYSTTTAAGCERIETLNLTINHSENNIIPISSCTPYTWHGTTYSASGNYEFDGVTEANCDLHEVLQLTINSAVTNDIYEDACESFTWTDGDGETYTTSGIHEKVFATSTCDSTVILHLTIHHNETAAPEVVEACDGYEWNGTMYTASGVYYYDAPLEGGCVRHETLNLTINDSETENIALVECDSLVWHGQTYTTSGYYTFDTVTAAGCPRVENLNLTINKNTAVTLSATACDEYIWHGQSYTQSGSYTFDTINATGCILTQTLNLTINESEEELIEKTECDSYVWHGYTYTESGVYTYPTTTAAGCPRIETLNLIINQGGVEHIYDTACDNYTWYDVTYTQGGVYDHQTVTESGCTVIEKLHLTVNHSEADHIYESVCDSYPWYDSIYAESGVYTHVSSNAANCTRTEYLHLIVNKSEDIQLYDTVCDIYTWYGHNYTESGSYAHPTTTAAGCDRIETLNLIVNHSENHVFDEFSCEPYTWHDSVYTVSGNYTFNGSTENDCNLHEVLHLTISEATNYDVYVDACESYTWEDGDGGTYTTSGEHEVVFSTSHCDSIVTLHLTIHHDETANTVYAEACGSYEWNDSTYTESGIYYHYTPLQGGCVKTETLNLTIFNNVVIEPETVVACENYEWNDSTYTESGTYTVETQLETGCTSIETLNLTIVHNENPEPEVVAICADEYSWNDSTYTESGTYTHVTALAGGCLMTETLELTLNQPIENSFDVNACDIYIWNNVSYTEDGDYSQTLTAANGCDSIVNIHLTLTSSVTSEFSAEACDHYIWNNIVYGNTGDFNQTFAAANGCDSIVTLHLTIKLPVYHEFEAVECPGYIWNGSTYTMSGDYTQTFIGSNECDSIVTMHLTIKESPYSEFTMVACDSYVWDGIEYTDDGNYFHTYEAANGCDSTVVMILTINESPIASITGDLWVATGVQDSTVLTAWGGSSYLWSTGDTTQSITVAPYIETNYYVTVTDENGCSSVAEVTVINSTGIDENAIDVNVYPNPTKHVVYIEAEGIRNVRLTDMLGQVLVEKNESADRVQIDLSAYAAAQYFLQVYTSQGMVTRKIIKK